MREAFNALAPIIALFAAYFIGRLGGYREGMKDAKAIFLADRDDPTTPQGE